MGNSARPGSIVTSTIPHESFKVGDDWYHVEESAWNGSRGRHSFDVVRDRDSAVLTEESFDAYPTEAEITAVLEDHGADIELEM